MSVIILLRRSLQFPLAFRPTCAAPLTAITPHCSPALPCSPPIHSQI